MMDAEYYDKLPNQIAERAGLYLKKAREIMGPLAQNGYENRESFLLAAAMMQLESAEIISSSIDVIAERLEERS